MCVGGQRPAGHAWERGRPPLLGGGGQGGESLPAGEREVPTCPGVRGGRGGGKRICLLNITGRR